MIFAIYYTFVLQILLYIGDRFYAVYIEAIRVMGYRWKKSRENRTDYGELLRDSLGDDIRID